MRASQLALLALLAGATALAACDKARPVAAAPGASTACTGCHGGLENATGAPPLDTRGNALTTVMTVGAHTSHVNAWLDCDACHVKPARVSDPGHIDGQVLVPFGQVAKLHGATPSFDPATGLCSNVYCHGATLPVSARGLTTTPRWNGTTLPQPHCNYCHGQPGSSSGAPASHGAGPLDCSTCHPDTVLPGGEIKPPAQGGRHVDGNVDVNCAGCHGDRGRGETTDLLAAAPPVDTAGASTGAKVGAHLRHVSGVATLGSRLSSPFACTECHRVPTTVTASPPGHGISPVVQFGTAAAPAKNLATTGGLVPVYTAATGGCATTYCHGAGLGAGGTNHAPTWGATGAAACGTCHFQATTVASAPGHAQVDKAGAPFTSNAQCSGCHPGTVKADGTIDLTLGNHVDGVVEATSPHPAGWLTDHGNKAKLNLQGPGGCTSCHGAGFDTVVATSAAGKPESCNTCHANPADFIAGYTGQQHPSWRTECTFCHGDATLTRAAVATGPAAADTVGSPAANLVNAVLAAPERGSQGEMSATASAVGAHQRHVSDSATTGNRLAYAFRCQECHGVNVLTDAAHTGVDHVDGQVVMGWQLAASRGATPAPAAGSYPAARDATGLARATPTSCTNYCHGATLSGGAASKAVTWTSPGTAGCGTCHGLPPDAPHPGVGAGTNCGGCHAGYDCTAANVAACTVNKALHVNGALDGGGESAGGSACGGCHATIFGGMNGTVTKTTKHTLGAVAGTNDAPTDSGVTWSGLATLGAVAPAQRSCTNMCHGDHPHDTTSPASATHQANLYADPSTLASRGDGAATRVVTGGTGTVNRARTDFDATSNVGMCATCHATPIATGGLTVSAATFGASAHDFTATAAPAVTWQYTLHDGGAFQRNCTKCHASAVEGTTPTVGASGSATAAVHFGDNAALLSGTLNPAGSAAGFVCYNCHGSTASPAAGAQGNRSNKDIQTQIAKTTGSVHPANADAVHDTVAELGAAAFGNALGGKARHSSCMDCHDPHEAKSGTHTQGTNLAGPPLQGAWGVRFGGTLAAFAAPTTANFTKVTSMVAGTDLEATLCFKCHSAYYGALPTSPSGTFTETDQAREFNPANPSFHPVLASNSGTVGNTGNVIAPWTRTSLMTCTDCHESNSTTDPNGPHGSTAKFLLKGPNTTWSSSVASLGNNAWMPAGTFCLNCHANNAAASRFPAHSRSGDHSIACTGCHVLIPHGSGHVGMLVSLPGGAGGTAVTDSAPYAVGVRLGIGSYPSAAGNWSNSNCGCDSVSTGH